MAASSRHSEPSPGSPRRSGPSAADPVGTSEASAWWRQLRSTLPRWLLAVLTLLAFSLGGVLYWYTHA